MEKFSKIFEESNEKDRPFSKIFQKRYIELPILEVVLIGPPYLKLKLYFKTLTLAPTEEMGRQFGDFIFGKSEKHEISYLNCGHLCSIPYIPVVDCSFMGFSDYRKFLKMFQKVKILLKFCKNSTILKTWKRFILDWSRNKSDPEKVKEAAEIENFYKKVLFLLNDHFQ